MSIAENIFLVASARRGSASSTATTVYRRTRELLAQVGLRESPDTLITDLGVGKQQLVEIAKALSKKVRLLILDEPTASLNEADSAALLDRLVTFREQGIASILISHKLNEVARVADRITVLRDGRTVDYDRLPHRAGRGGPHHPQHGRSRSRPSLSRAPGQDRRSRAGGRGLVGASSAAPRAAGDQERRLPGAARGGRRHRRPDGRGPHRIRHEPVRPGLGHQDQWPYQDRRARGSSYPNVPAAIDAGLAYVTEDRKQLGLILADDIRKNITLASLGQVASRGVIDDIRELKAASDYRNRMRIRSQDVYQEAGQLSGGNQQKVVLSKWLMTGPKVLILDEPTRGIDVGAKYEIYTIINELAEAGKGVVVISSEMAELLGICDRICVMNDGAFVGEFDGRDATQEQIMRTIMRNERIARSFGQARRVGELQS